MLRLYNKITKALQPIILPLLSKINDPHISKKLYLNHTNNDKKVYYDILIHAVSVGELNVAIALSNALKKLRPDIKLAFTVSTKTGYEKAINSLGKEYPVYIYPLDFPESVKNFFNTVSTRLYVTIETEIWPNFFYYAKKNNAKIAIVNARISKRSYKNYLKIKGIIRETLNLVDGISTITDKFKTRFINLGVEPNKIKSNGNAKYELLLNYVKENRDKKQYIAEKLQLDNNKRVITYGSIRKNEAKEVIRAIGELHKKSKDIIQIVAPRHLQFLDYFKVLLDREGIKYQSYTSLLNERRHTDVILVDTLGLLMDIYAVSDIAFVGGTLEPVGGHNIMEPAAWSCPVIFGPYVDNVEDAATELIKNNGGIMVRNWRELVETVMKCIFDGKTTQVMGKNAFNSLNVLGENSAMKHARFLLDIFKERY